MVALLGVPFGLTQFKGIASLPPSLAPSFLQLDIAGALQLGIARALIDVEIDDRPALKKAGFLTRDPRVKERKKYGLKKARKAPQYSKR